VSFDTLISAGAPIRRVIAIDVSVDNWATVYRRWSDVSMQSPAGNWYEQRLVSIAPIKRALGQNRIVASTSTEITLDNGDGALDFMCGSSAVSLVSKMRFRVYVWVADSTAPFTATSDYKLLGEFSCTEWPKQSYAAVTLLISDDVLGRIGDGCVLPTIADWEAIGGSESTNPLMNYEYSTAPIIDRNATPIQLAFGEDWVQCLPAILSGFNRAAAGPYYKKLIVPVCCTSDTAGTPGAYPEIGALRVEMYTWKNDGTTVFVDIPQSKSMTYAGVFSQRTIWSIERSPVITKNGKSFRIIYLVVAPDLGFPDGIFQADDDAVSASGGSFSSVPTTTANTAMHAFFEFSGGYDTLIVNYLRANPVAGGVQIIDWAWWGSRVVGWYIKGPNNRSGISASPGACLSSRTQSRSRQQHAVDVASDLALYYSSAVGLTVDAVARSRVKAGSSQSRATGVVQPWTSGTVNLEWNLRAGTYRPPLSMRQVLTKLAQSSDIDIFVNWAGQLSFSSDLRDYITDTSAATLIDIDHTQINNLERWVPSLGERGAVYNRISLTGGRAELATGQPVPFQGPWTADASWGAAAPTVSPADRLIEVQLEQGWRPYEQQVQPPWTYRMLDFQARDRIRFATNIGGLRLELGQYFTLTKRITGVTTIKNYYQCEAITYAPGDDSVEIEAVQRDDIVSNPSYLLDDELLLIRTKNISGQTASVDDTTNIVDFSGTINLSTMGVVVGDILVIRDSTVAIGSMNRNKAVRISAIVTNTRLGYASPLGPIDATSTPFTVADADWYIIRGATTGPTAISDPTNYPNGSAIYGKMTDASGQDSNTEPGNQLLSG